MARLGKRSLLGIGALVVIVLAGGIVVLQSPAGFGGLFGPIPPEQRADQVLAGIKAETPYLALLEQRRPEVYDELRATLAQDAADGASVMEMANNGRRVLASWFIGAIATAPDSVALEMLAVTTDQFRTLGQTNPRMCADMAKGQAFGDLGPYVGEDLLAREHQVYEMLLTTPAAEDLVALPPAEIEAANQSILPDLTARFGDDLALMQAATIADDDVERFCTIQVAILEAIAAMEPERAAAMARALLGGS